MECRLAIDYLPIAIEYREKNLGHKGICMDISEYKKDDAHAADLLWTSPPCFVAGTMVLCHEGYKPIEEVIVGDVVLTHKGRWRTVTSTMSRKDATVIRVHAQGVPGVVCTKEHPFYVREMKFKSVKKKRVRGFGIPSFMEASMVKRDAFLSQVNPPVNWERAVLDEDTHSPAFWFMIGRYLADGWRGDRDRCVTICGNLKESREIKKLIAAAGYEATKETGRTSVKFHIRSPDLYGFVIQFGKYAHGKRIPGWVHSLGVEQVKSLLGGYFSGDGCRYEDTRCWTANSASKSLALGIALLCQRGYGRIASCTFCKRPRTCMIEGRKVRQRSYWRVSLFDHNRSGVIDGEYGWKRFRKSSPAGKATVYNLSVDEDESYMADGAIVHNCQTFSSARDVADDPTDVRNHLYMASVNYAKEFKPRFFVLENVVGMLSHDSDGLGGGTLARFRKAFSDLGYNVEWNILNSRYFGVPQSRPRVFIVGSLTGEVGLIPAHPRAPRVSFGDIMERNMEELAWGGSTYATAMEKIQRTGIGMTVVEGKDRKPKRGVRDNGLPRDMLPTLTCGFGGGPTRKKCCVLDESKAGLAFLRDPSVREGARAQGFPDEWVFPDNFTDAWKLVGNAVASPVSEAIARHLIAVSEGKTPPSKEELTSDEIRSAIIRRQGNDEPPNIVFEEDWSEIQREMEA